mgnify:CR=1 FL=1
MLLAHTVTVIACVDFSICLTSSGPDITVAPRLPSQLAGTPLARRRCRCGKKSSTCKKQTSEWGLRNLCLILAAAAQHAVRQGMALQVPETTNSLHVSAKSCIMTRTSHSLASLTLRALEQQLAEAAAEAQQRAAQQHEAHAAALAALQQRMAALEASLREQQQSAAEMAQRNGQLSSSQAELTAQLAEAKRAAAQAAAASSHSPSSPSPSLSSLDATTPTKSLPTVSTPPALGREKSLVDVHTSPSGAPGSGGAASGDGPHSPRTPLGWDAGAASSPISSSTSSSSTASNGNGSGSGVIQRRVSEDTPPAHPHIRPTSPTEAQQQPGNTTSLRPHTAPHSDYLNRSLSLGNVVPPTPPLGAGSSGPGSSSGGAAESVLVFSPSEPDLSPDLETRGLLRLNSLPGPGGLGVASTSPNTSVGGGAGGAGVTASRTLEGSALYLAGVGPPPMSPVAAAAGLSGAGVALLAKQKKQIATLRAQLQQKDSAYAFLANEHSELEGQLKEVEAAKREYAARCGLGAGVGEEGCCGGSRGVG